MKTRENTKRITAWLIACVMLIAMAPFTVSAADGDRDFNIVNADTGEALTEGTDYKWQTKLLTIHTSKPVAVSMKSGVGQTDNIIVIEADNNTSNVILNNVDIKTGEDYAVELKNNYSTGGKEVTLDIYGTTTLEAKSAGIAIHETPLRLTSTNNGTLNIKNGKFGIDGSSDNTKINHPITIDGTVKLNVTGCTSHAVYNLNSGLAILGAPVINITSGGYALYGVGVDIWGGKITAKNTSSGFVICSGGNNDIVIKNEADITIKSGISGVQAANASVNIGDSAKLKIQNVKRNPLTCGGLNVSGKALLDILSNEGGISAATLPSKISDNAEVIIKINNIKNFSKHVFSFGSTLDITDNAKVNAEALAGGDKVDGFKSYSGTLNISGNANVSVKGTKNAVYAKLNMSGNAKAEMTTTGTPITDVITVTPEASRAYLIKSGASKSEATETYYAQKTENLNLSSSVKYFSAEPADLVDVLLTGVDSTTTYNGEAINLILYFLIDTNAGDRTYSLEPYTDSSFAGEGTINGKMLTVTKAGIFKIKLTTAPNGKYRAGEAIAMITVQKGDAPEIIFKAPSDIIYGDTLAQATFPTDAHGEFKWEDETIIPDGIGAKSYKVTFVPNDADLYDYTLRLTSDNVPVQVKPRPVEIEWKFPDGIIYDGNAKRVQPNIKNIVGDDITAPSYAVYEKADGEWKLKSDAIINAGTYKAVFESSGNENYTLEGGTNLEKEFEIMPKALNADNITAIPDQTYTKEEIKPVIEVKDGDKVLALDTDYKVTYENNINAGTAKAKVEFIGNYSGTAEKEFTILPKTIDKEIPLFAPVKKAMPQTTIDTEEYSAVITWSPDAGEKFGYKTVYTATVTITPKANYTVNGIAENGYVFENAQSVQNTANSAAVTVTYPATGGRNSGGDYVTLCIVTFTANGGSKTMNQTVARGSTLKKPADPTKNGYTFAGWYTDSKFAEKYDFSSKVTKNMTLYAKWTSEDNSENEIILTIGQKEAVVFGKTKTNDVAPIIRNDRTMLPARFVAEELGAKVSWNEAERKVTIKKTDVEIILTIDSDIALVNGEEIKLDSPAFIENDRTYTSVRFIAENLGASVDWNEGSRKVIITK